MSTEGTTVEVNGAQLYHEVRGSGPPVLFISAITGDAGHWKEVGDLLSNEFTVVAYDRRGNSRSPRPADWTKTSIDEQADDAAELVRALGLAPAAVVGTSVGAVILLNLLLRHPEVLRGAIVHEPMLVAVLANAAEVGAMLQAMAEAELTKGGPRGALEVFTRANVGDATFERLDPALRERMLGNAEVVFGVELEAFGSWVPDTEALAAVRVPVQVVAGAESRDAYYYDAVPWVAEQLGTELREVPGAHAPYLAQPEETAEALRPLLREFS
jgi:pimeloyl-ACP methyl ester carboxylesterase